MEDVSFAQSLDLLSENNYGYAGEEYIIDESITEEGRFRGSMDVIPGSHLDNIAVVCLSK